jgi:hypothetical protein
MSEKAFFPKFRTTGDRKNPKVFLLCSMCGRDIKEIKPNESVQIDRLHFCEEHEPKAGTVIPNDSTGGGNA